VITFATSGIYLQEINIKVSKVHKATTVHMYSITVVLSTLTSVVTAVWKHGQFGAATQKESFMEGW
jgi:hypothetical protein